MPNYSYIFMYARLIIMELETFLKIAGNCFEIYFFFYFLRKNKRAERLLGLFLEASWDFFAQLHVRDCCRKFATGLENDQ